MTEIVGRGTFSVIERERSKTGRGRRPVDPKLFARVDEFPEADDDGQVRMYREWALYVNVVKGGQFRRLPLSLAAAKLWLTQCLAEVDEALTEDARKETSSR